jgi:ribonucleotide reductase alpha subunit
MCLVTLQVAVCNLGSIALNMFVKPDKTFDIPKLKEVTKVLTRNLNKIIEINYYPVPEVRFLLLYYDEFSSFESLFF